VSPIASQKPSILIVEDSDEDFAAMERILLRSEAPVGLHRCSRAEQTYRLLDEWQQHPSWGQLPALIVLDLNLPGPDGRTILKELRRRDATKRIPVVIFSTSSSQNDITWCYENGANSYHVKGMDYPVFKHSVEQLSSYWLRSAQLPGSERSHAA